MKIKFLSPPEIRDQGLLDEMWEIYHTSFDTTYEEFLQSQENFDAYGLFFSRSGRIVGFCGILDGETTMNGKIYRTVYMGHFSMVRSDVIVRLQSYGILKRLNVIVKSEDFGHFAGQR